jgi:coenzyme PQQ synthesis protein D (PqqD)
MIDDATHYIRTPHKASVDLEMEGVVLDLDSGVYFGLEGVGQRIWELLETPATPVSLRERLLEEYEVTDEVVRSDTQRFMEQLLANKLIEPRG